MADGVPPLRRPEGWRGASAFGRWSIALGVVLLVAGLGIGILALVRDQTAHAPFIAIASGGGFVAWGLVLLGMSLPRHPGSPVLVNAVAVIPGDERPTDGWVHLFPRRRLGRGVAAGFTGLGLYLVALGVGSVVLVATGAEDASILLFAGLPVAAGVVTATLGVREALARRRSGTFGRAPLGLALGASGVTILDVGATRFVPWEAVTGVAAINARGRGGRETPMHPQVVVQLAPVGAGRPEHVVQWMNHHVVDARVVYSALATARESPGFRARLGTSAAQDVLDAWVAEAATAAG